MTRARPPLLLLLPPALLLTACGESGAQDKRSDRPPAPPLGYELALAHTGGGDRGADAAAPFAASASVIDLTPVQLAARVEAGNVRLIDVRTDAEGAGQPLGKS